MYRCQYRNGRSVLGLRTAVRVTLRKVAHSDRQIVKVGDLVLLRGSMWSSYGQRDDVGLVLETVLMTNRNGYPDAEFSRVLWGKDGDAKLYKTEHLEVLNECGRLSSGSAGH